MNNREDIIAEIMSISATVAAVPFMNVFTVDEAYFSTLPTIIMAQINVGGSLNSARNLAVPDGYFKSLAGNILSKIHALENDATAELNDISPLLAGINNKETYKALEGYFEGLALVENQKTVKVISISKTR